MVMAKADLLEGAVGCLRLLRPRPGPTRGHLICVIVPQGGSHEVLRNDDRDQRDRYVSSSC
jgi:hypothetical protein